MNARRITHPTPNNSGKARGSCRPKMLITYLTHPKKNPPSPPKHTRNFCWAHPQASNPKTSLSLLSPLGYSCSWQINTSTNSRKTKLRLVFFFPPVPPSLLLLLLLLPSSSYHTKLFSIVGSLSISFLSIFTKSTTQSKWVLKHPTTYSLHPFSLDVRKPRKPGKPGKPTRQYQQTNKQTKAQKYKFQWREFWEELVPNYMGEILQNPSYFSLDNWFFA
jgi:hypothetical protein